MKRYFVILALIAISQAGFSQTMNQLFDSFSKQDHVTKVTSNEKDSRTKVMIRIDKEMIRELVVLTTGKDNALIRIKGKIKPSDIEKVVKNHGNGC